MNDKFYDLIIIGAGPAGLTASIYASRYHLRHLVISANLGGTIAWAHKVENYPGFSSISGAELSQKFVEHAQSLGAEIKNQDVISIEKNDENSFLVKTNQNQSYQTKTIILATGTKRRKLNIPGEDKYLGRGVSYCATCDAAFYKDKTVAVVGGANASCSGSIYLAEFAKKVYLIYRRDKLRAMPVHVKQVQQNNKIEVIYQTNVTEIIGHQMVEKIKLDKKHQGKDFLIVDGIFIEIGGVPQASLVQGLNLEVDQQNYIKTNKNMITNIRGIFCAGDINDQQKQLQQAVTAASEGAIAAQSAYQYLGKL